MLLRTPFYWHYPMPPIYRVGPAHPYPQFTSGIHLFGPSLPSFWCLIVMHLCSEHLHHVLNHQLLTPSPHRRSVTPCFRHVVDHVCHVSHTHIPQLLIVQATTCCTQQHRSQPCSQLLIPPLHSGVLVAVIALCSGLQPCLLLCISLNHPHERCILVTVKPYSHIISHLKH